MTLTLGWWVIPLLITIVLPIIPYFRWRKYKDFGAAMMQLTETLACFLVAAVSWIIYFVIT